jgi:hypothetical protein
MKIKNISKLVLTIPKGSSYVALEPAAEMEISFDDYALVNPHLKLQLAVGAESSTKVEPAEGKTKAIKE